MNLYDTTYLKRVRNICNFRYTQGNRWQTYNNSSLFVFSCFSGYKQKVVAIKKFEYWKIQKSNHSIQNFSLFVPKIFYTVCVFIKLKPKSIHISEMFISFGILISIFRFWFKNFIVVINRTWWFTGPVFWLTAQTHYLSNSML